MKEPRPRDLLESSSDSDEKVPVAKPSSLSKRKLELEVETVEKKKKGRPRKDSRLLPVSLSVQVRPAPVSSPCELSAGASVCLISGGTGGLDTHAPLGDVLAPTCPQATLPPTQSLSQLPGVSHPGCKVGIAVAFPCAFTLAECELPGNGPRLTSG